MEEIKWDTWYDEHLPEIIVVQKELERVLPDDLFILRKRLMFIESQYSRIGRLLADCNSILAIMTSETDEIATLAKIRRIRDILGVQQKAISKRITVGQSLIKSFREEEMLARSMEKH